MERQRAQAIVIQDDKILFGIGFVRKDHFGHFFIGGGVEAGESPEEAAVRELREEANVEGNVLFQIEGGPFKDHHTFLVDIGDQIPILGFDPEKDEQEKKSYDKALQGLELISFDDYERFTSMDIAYFELLHRTCLKKNYRGEWVSGLENLICKHKPYIAGILDMDEE